MNASLITAALAINFPQLTLTLIIVGFLHYLMLFTFIYCYLRDFDIIQHVRNWFNVNFLAIINLLPNFA